MSEFLEDLLGEDQELDEREINRIVNDWIQSQLPLAWEAAKTRPTPASVLEAFRQRRLPGIKQ
jgi:hypothetical protein